MDSYSKVKSGALKLKGEKKHKKHKKSKKRDHSGDRGDVDEAKKRKREVKEDCDKHGGWWVAEKIFEVTGPIAIQFPNSCFMKAMDNGKFVLGAPHDEGEQPSPEEVVMAMRSGDGKISLKSGFDKYLRVGKNGYLMGVSDAVGGLELFEPIWEDGKCALLGANGKFLTVDDDDMVLCSENKVGPMEVIRIRSNKEREDVNKKKENSDESGSAADIELKFTKKFLKFQDKKYRARFDNESQGTIMAAKQDGRLHEALLDRREKMKSDRMYDSNTKMMHPNWRALATCQVQFKKFVRATEEDKVVRNDVENDRVGNSEKTGQEIKDFYDDVISNEELRRRKVKLETAATKVETVELSDDDDCEVIDHEAQKKLLVAIQNEDMDIIKTVLKDCDMNEKDEYGWTPLEIAAVTGNTDIVECLLDQGATVGNEDRLRAALVKKNLFDVIDLLWNRVEIVEETAGEIVMVSCDDCGQLYEELRETDHRASISHQLSLETGEEGMRNPGFLLNEGNVGFKMMKRGGWDGVSGLGEERDGKLFPVKTVFKHDRRGLDIGDKKLMRITHFGPGDVASVENRRKRKQQNQAKKLKKVVYRGSKQISVNVPKEQMIREDIGYL